jgi:hypothetical protein
MKATIVTDANGEIVGAHYRVARVEVKGAPQATTAIAPAPGQVVHEVDLPAEDLAAILDDADKLFEYRVESGRGAPRLVKRT